MANLIIKGSDSIPAGIFESTVEVTNWRAVGTPRDNYLYLVLANFETYLITTLQMGKFLEMVRLNLDFQVRGELVSISPSCPSCAGSGITDWVSKIVDHSNRVRIVDENFKRDPTGKLYKAHNQTRLNTTHNIPPFVCYYSTAILPEAMEYCEKCKGNGMYYFSNAARAGIAEVTSYERM